MSLAVDFVSLVSRRRDSGATLTATASRRPSLYGRSLQLGRTSAPMMPQQVQTMRGPKAPRREGTIGRIAPWSNRPARRTVLGFGR